MGMFGQLVSMATRALSGRSGSGGRRGSGKQSGTRSQMAQQVGSQIVEQVRRQGPDAAQRHLSRTKFADDPRARKAAKTADDLARRFAGSDAAEPPRPARKDEPPVNRYGERP